MTAANTLGFWLDELGDLFAPIVESPDRPLCFLLGAGASLSSGAPSTAAVLAALRRTRPRLFGSDEDVYNEVPSISHQERECIDPLFRDVTPFVGYRCLGTLAHTRPIVVVNLNWDDCVPRAARAVGVPDDEISIIDVEDTTDGEAALDQLLDRGRGVLSIHVHGYFADQSRSDVRFGTKETLEFETAEFKLLRRAMSLQTIIVGTSLAGPHDAGGLVDALVSEGKVDAPVWVAERGPWRRQCGFGTEPERRLSEALIARSSTNNFLASPAVDFDLLLASLRAAETGRTWELVVERADTQLPPIDELILPHVAALRSVLDRPVSVLVGRPLAGRTRIAYMMGWLLSLLTGRREVHSSGSGPEYGTHAIGRLTELSPADGRPVLVLEECFGHRSYRQRAALVSGLASLGADGATVICTASPHVWQEAVATDSTLEELNVVTVLPDKFWNAETLRAYAGSKAPHKINDLLPLIEEKTVTTPAEIDRAIAGLPAIDDEDDHVAEVVKHLQRLRDRQPGQALLIALARLQAFHHARPEEELERLAGASVESVLSDPWGLLRRYTVDGKFQVRLVSGMIVNAVDEWLWQDIEWVSARILKGGESGLWASEAWSLLQQFRQLDPTPEQARLLQPAHRELYGSELVEGALRRSLSDGIEVLEVLCERAEDFWALRDVSMSLVMHWEKLGADPRARNLRDAIILDEDRDGAYGLFECMLRRGGTAPLDLWHPVCARLLELSRDTTNSTSARRQVALTFDSLLWRTAPSGPEGHLQLLRELLAAAERDPLLEAAYVAGAAYHFKSSSGLSQLGLRNPIDRFSGATHEQARAMAWLVAWHFLHQSRIRSLVSRRDFRSTRNDPGSERTHLLNRSACEKALATDHADALSRVAGEMAKFDDTAGWAVHLILNANATLGEFAVPDLPRWLEITTSADTGLIGAAITYGMHPETEKALARFMRHDDAEEALLAALGEGLSVFDTVLRPPRFLAVSEHWRTRARWSIDNEPLERLGLPFADPEKMMGLFRAAVPQAVEFGASEANLDVFLRQLESSDTRLLHAIVPKVPSERLVSGSPNPVQILVLVSELMSPRLFPES
jgi:hypothetical protein